MRKILLGLFILFIISCNNKEKTNNIIDTLNIDTKKNSEEILGIKPILKNAILKYIDRTDSISKAKTSFSEKKLFIARFIKKENDCFFIIAHTYCYQKEGFIGFIMLKDKMIALYDTPEGCKNSLINNNLLKQKVNKKFLNCDEVDAYPYDPEIVVYKILDTDSLEFLRYGWL